MFKLQSGNMKELGHFSKRYLKTGNYNYWTFVLETFEV